MLSKVNTLIIDVDGVLFPETQLSIQAIIAGIKDSINKISVTKKEYDLIRKQVKRNKQKGLYNLALKLCKNDKNKYQKFCDNVVDAIDYSTIKPNPELYQLLERAGRNHDIFIFTNNTINHVDKVYYQLWGKTSNDVFFKTCPVEFTEKNGYFHPKQSNDGFPIFLEKINKKPSECILLDDTEVNINMALSHGLNAKLISEDYPLSTFLKGIVD